MTQRLVLFCVLVLTVHAHANEHLLRLEADLHLAETEATALENALAAEARAVEKLPALPHSAAYRRFRNFYDRKFPNSDVTLAAVLANSGLSQTPRGTFVALSPVDPERPAVIVTADPANEKAVEDVVTELRGKTTAALLSGGGGIFKSKKNLMMRANSILVGATHEEFKSVIAETRAQLKQLSAQAARSAVYEALRRMNSGPLLTAFAKLERAATGGLGSRRFETDLSASLPDALRRVAKTQADILRLLAVRIRLEATKKAVALRKQAMEVGKPGDLVGFELFPSSKYQNGVEYVVHTTDGKTYTLANVGKNFANPKGPYVPSADYARLNVALLKAYEAQGGLTPEAFFAIAQEKGFLPTDDGRITLARP